MIDSTAAESNTKRERIDSTSEYNDPPRKKSVFDRLGERSGERSGNNPYGDISTLPFHQPSDLYSPNDGGRARKTRFHPRINLYDWKHNQRHIGGFSGVEGKAKRRRKWFM